MYRDDKSKKVRVRGTGCYNPETQEFGFTPFNEAPSTQTNVKSCSGGGKRWTTTGADPSRMLSLKCREKSADMYSDLLAQFEALTKDLKPQHTVQQPDATRVVAEENLQCWLDAQKAELTYTGKLNLERSCHLWQAELLRQMQILVRRLPANENFNKVLTSLKRKGGLK